MSEERPIRNEVVQRFIDGHEQGSAALHRALLELTYEELQDVLTSARSYSQSNCGWMAYDAAQHLLTLAPIGGEEAFERWHECAKQDESDAS